MRIIFLIFLLINFLYAIEKNFELLNDTSQPIYYSLGNQKINPMKLDFLELAPKKSTYASLDTKSDAILLAFSSKRPTSDSLVKATLFAKDAKWWGVTATPPVGKKIIVKIVKDSGELVVRPQTSWGSSITNNVGKSEMETKLLTKNGMAVNDLLSKIIGKQIDPKSSESILGLPKLDLKSEKDRDKIYVAKKEIEKKLTTRDVRQFYSDASTKEINDLIEATKRLVTDAVLALARQSDFQMETAAHVAFEQKYGRSEPDRYH